MKNISRHDGILRLIKRENSSLNGNPRYLCFIDNGRGHGFSFYTAPDSMLAYSVPNYFDKPVTITMGTYYGKPTLSTINSTL